MPRRAYRKRGDVPVAPEDVREPYERFLYNELRNELVRRQITFLRSGPRAVTTKAGFMRVLREADKNSPEAARAATAGVLNSDASEQRSEPTTTTESTTSAKPAAAGKRGAAATAASTGAGAGASPTAARAPQKAVRAARPRRGCRFRLINVLLSPDFNTRWREMITRGANNTLEVNSFWLDVHVAFNQQNSLFDALHFQDALFVNVEPSVILKHSAARLLQMWIEVVGMYRTAVRSAQQATDAGNTSQSFFDFCAGRLDLLYLHMALLLESELFEFVMGDTIPGSDTMPVAKIKIVDRTAREAASPAIKPLPRKGSIGNKKEAAAGTHEATANEAVAGSKGKAHASAATPKATTTPVKKMRQQKLSTQSTPPPTTYVMPTVPASAPTVAASLKPPGATTPTAGVRRTQPPDMTGMPIQNPELAIPVLVAAPAAAPHKNTPPKKTTKAAGHAKEKKVGAKHSTAKPSASTTASIRAEQPNTMVTVQPTSTSHGAQSTLMPVIIPQPAPSANAPQPMGENTGASRGRPSDKRSHHGVDESESNGDGSVSSDYDAVPRDARSRRRSSAKRLREPSETSTDIVAVPDSNHHAGSTMDLVPHPHKRFHTTVSTAITPARPATELMLPPDEWDILENRLRKTNENIDRCHRALTGIEANMSDSYRQTLEADLRFFSAIKQRLQEQLLVVMQSGY